MSNRQKKTLKLLLILLALLAVGLIISVTMKARSAAQAEAEEKAREEAAVLVQEPQEGYTALSYFNGTTTLSFHVDEESGEWVWSDDPAFPLDDANILAITDLLDHLKPQQTITDGDTLESYGLNSPSAKLSATAADGGVLNLEFGRATTDGTSRYVLMNSQESPVYIIADTLLQKMDTPIYDMCRLPEVPDLDSGNIRSVRIQGAASVYLTAEQAEGEDAETVWTYDGTDVSGNRFVTALTDQLSAMRFHSCVDYRPTDKAAAICGFDAPAATLSVTYTGEGGGEGTFELTVGKFLPENSPVTGRYVQVGSDSTIYRMESPHLEAIMALASKGLSA